MPKGGMDQRAAQRADISWQRDGQPRSLARGPEPTNARAPRPETERNGRDPGRMAR